MVSKTYSERFNVVALFAGSVNAVVIVFILMLPKIIRALAHAYVLIKRINFETKEKTPPHKR